MRFMLRGVFGFKENSNSSEKGTSSGGDDGDDDSQLISLLSRVQYFFYLFFVKIMYIEKSTRQKQIEIMCQNITFIFLRVVRSGV